MHTDFSSVQKVKILELFKPSPLNKIKQTLKREQRGIQDMEEILAKLSHEINQMKRRHKDLLHDIKMLKEEEEYDMNIKKSKMKLAEAHQYLHECTTPPGMIVEKHFGKVTDEEKYQYVDDKSIYERRSKDITPCEMGVVHYHCAKCGWQKI